MLSCNVVCCDDKVFVCIWVHPERFWQRDFSGTGTSSNAEWPCQGNERCQTIYYGEDVAFNWLDVRSSYHWDADVPKCRLVHVPVGTWVRWGWGGTSVTWWRRSLQIWTLTVKLRRKIGQHTGKFKWLRIVSLFSRYVCPRDFVKQAVGAYSICFCIFNLMHVTYTATANV